MRKIEQFNHYLSHPATALVSAVGSVGLGIKGLYELAQTVAIEQPTPADHLIPFAYGTGTAVLAGIAVASGTRVLRKYDQ